MSEREFGPIETSPKSLWPPYDEYVPGQHARDVCEAALRDALRDIELGVYDRVIVKWLADWDTPTVAVVISLLERARVAGELGVR
jgi:hypothetical protein